ncbi:hypothetical protein M409DRAFT_59211 [Zasmidium cellare ATCC 36951]|uniref:Uncharacterized protein n=1 Tax=Zasmidium cellare ATCC 36951 TaxID=1080233 RepID=A0A6A6C2I5_ZASCE|nr:uncharacterized protein M409DRAFT_59211 [Zasmidium cellare ATCC 36951]KAF2161205.1 hypothetical protein M409DRAFT_59211 [Zasmidium cellare ATCC 36951]
MCESESSHPRSLASHHAQDSLPTLWSSRDSQGTLTMFDEVEKRSPGQQSANKSGSENERPLKRVRADAMAGALDSKRRVSFAPLPDTTSYRSAYDEAEAALKKLTVLDRDQAVHLLKNHFEVSELLHAANRQGSGESEGAVSLNEVDATIQELIQEKDQLEAALSEELEVLEKAKQALERKVESSTKLCSKMLQQNMSRLEDGLGDLRDEARNYASAVTKHDKDKEIARLHGLIGQFAEKIVDEFKTSLTIASKMLGHPIASTTTANAQVQESPRETHATPKTVDAAKAGSPEDEFEEDDLDLSEYEEQSRKEQQNPKNKKLYGTEYVDSHPNQNFFHRASGRWMKGLPPLEASNFTGVRGPDAKKWKKMKEKYEAKKPKTEVKAEKQATPKKVEQGATIKDEANGDVKVGNTTPVQDKTQVAASARKIQQLEATVRDLQFKLKELRSKLEEEVRARRKAEAELASSRTL